MTLDDVLKMLPSDMNGTITVARIIAALKKLPQDQPAHVQVEQHGLDWYFCISLKDLT